MPALPPGISMVVSQGRVGRNGKRTGKRTSYEVKAYNPQTKQTEYVGRYPTLDDAKEVKRRFEESHGAKTASVARMTFRTLVEETYLKRKETLDRVRRPIKDSTLKSNKYALRPFVARFGSTRVHRLDEDEIVQWCATQPGSVVEATRAMFSWAVELRIVKHNPMVYVRSRRGPGRKDLNIISTADLHALVAAARRLRPGLTGQRIAALLTLLACSGMRPSEAFALRPEHLDFDARRIAVHWQFDEYGRRQSLKNSRRRDIVMAPEVAAVMAPLLHEIPANDLLFRTVDGKKFNCKSKWHYYWEPIRTAVGLEGMDVYELRHYCATILLDNGASPEVIALQFGHSDHGDLIRRVYGHPDDKLMLARLDTIMRSDIRPILRRLEAVPPTDEDLQRRDAA